MKKIKAALRQLCHSFYLSTLLAIIFFIAAVVLLFNLRFFQAYYLSLENDIYSMVQNQAAYQAESVSSLLNEFTNLSAKIVNDSQLSRTVYTRNHLSACDALAKYDLSFYKYDNLIIYYPGEEYLLTADGTCKAEVAFPCVSNPNLMLQTVEQVTLPSVFSTSGFGADMDDSSLVFVYPNNRRSYVLFQLKHSTIKNMLNLNAESGGCNWHLIVGDDGKLLFSDCPSESEAALLPVIEIVTANGSAQNIQLQDASYLFISNGLPYDIRLLSLNQVIDQFDALNRTVNQSILYTASVVILGLLVLIVSFIRGYMPIAKLAQSAKRLVNAGDANLPSRDIDALRQVFLQYGQLAQEYNQSFQMFSMDQMKNMFILRVLNGHYTSNEESANICNHLGMSFSFPHYCACILLFDSAELESDKKLEDIVSDDFSVYFCQTENRRSALGIINCKQAERLADIGDAILQHLQDTMSATALPTVAIGHACEALQDIPRSYIEARTAMDYRLMFGVGTVILYDMTEQRQEDFAAYPRKKLNAFALGLLNWDVEEIQAQLSDIVSDIRSDNLSLQQVKCVCTELSASFMREAHNINSFQREEIEHFDIFHICEYASIDELVQHITELSISIKQCLESNSMLCQESNIQHCLALINDNFENSQFSLESLYDQFSITPQTLRRRFKKATGSTMSDYLIALRLNKAKQLLSTTTLDLTEICLQCGYTDQSSFIRVFKAKEGKTPGKYRELHRSLLQKLPCSDA